MNINDSILVTIEQYYIAFHELPTIQYLCEKYSLPKISITNCIETLGKQGKLNKFILNGKVIFLYGKKDDWEEF